MAETWTVLRILTWTTEFFAKRGGASARLDAEVLLAFVLGVERIQLYVQYDRPLTAAERDGMRAYVRRRGRGEPVQYLVGAQEFWSLAFEVRPGALIPRPDTEVLVEEGLAEARALLEAGRERLRLADVGTGTGCIAVAVAHELAEVDVFAGDVAPVPLELAPANAARNGVAERVHVLRGDGLRGLWQAAGAEPFDLVLSNPPYLAHSELAGLQVEVREFEPEVALVSGASGLEAYRRLAADAMTPGVLTDGGALAVEIGGAHQLDAVRRVMRDAGLVDIRARDDYAGRPRVVVARRPQG